MTTLVWNSAVVKPFLHSRSVVPIKGGVRCFGGQTQQGDLNIDIAFTGAAGLED
jgi:hypothetical protein